MTLCPNSMTPIQAAGQGQEPETEKSTTVKKPKKEDQTREDSAMREMEGKDGLSEKGKPGGMEKTGKMSERNGSGLTEFEKNISLILNDKRPDFDRKGGIGSNL